MTFAQRLNSSVAVLGRGVFGTLLGLGLAGALAFQSAPAFAQAAPASQAVPAAPPRAQGSGPALWVIRDADSTLYLFGTVHVLRPTTAWGSDRVDTAFESASDIWFEISNPDDRAAIVPLLQRYGRSETPLSRQLTSGELTLLDNSLRSIGMDMSQVDAMQPWLVSITLGQVMLGQAGYDPTSGVEVTLRNRAVAVGKPIHGLETVDQQVRILAEMSQATQLNGLRSGLRELDKGVEIMDGITNAWAVGDVGGVERLAVDRMRSQGAELYEGLLVRRNTDWAGQIQGILSGSGTVFIAVGAAHLAGPDSVQAILRQRGVAVDEVR